MSSEAPAPPGQSSASRQNGAPRRAFPVRASDLLKVRAVWILPLVLGCVVVALITAFYVGSVVDPLGHLHGLPVAVVNQDRGAPRSAPSRSTSASKCSAACRTAPRSLAGSR
jgi:hypothetical protein